jgi:hypothetical protein
MQRALKKVVRRHVDAAGSGSSPLAIFGSRRDKSFGFYYQTLRKTE